MDDDDDGFFSKGVRKTIIIGLSLVAAVVVGSIALNSTVYWVDQNARGAKLHFGALTTVKDPGGPYFKWPVVDSVIYYQTGLQMFDHQTDNEAMGSVITGDHFNSQLSYFFTWQEIVEEIPWQVANVNNVDERLDGSFRAAVKAKAAHMTIEDFGANLEMITQQVMAELKPEMLALYHVNLVDARLTKFTQDPNYVEAFKVRTIGNAQAAALAAFQGPLQNNPALLSLQEINRWDGRRSTVASPASSPLVTLPDGK